MNQRAVGWAFVAGQVVLLVALAASVVTVMFVDREARWEEAQLSERYDRYAGYAARTPRFVPGWPTRP